MKLSLVTAALVGTVAVGCASSPPPTARYAAASASVRAAHEVCLERLRQLERSGYQHELVTIAITSQWRFDNDPPFPPLAEFIALAKDAIERKE